MRQFYILPAIMPTLLAKRVVAGESVAEAKGGLSFSQMVLEVGVHFLISLSSTLHLGMISKRACYMSSRDMQDCFEGSNPCGNTL